MTPYYYKKPGQWTWTRHETSSLQRDVASGELKPDWAYRLEADPQNRTLAELLGRERVTKAARRSPEEVELLAPDGTLGVIIVVLSAIALALAIFLPWRDSSLNGRLGLLGAGLVGIGHGLRKIRASRLWQMRHRKRSNQSLQPTAGGPGV